MDDGATWEDLYTFPLLTGVYGVRDLDNGELLVSVNNFDAAVPGALWLSSGYPTLGAGASWTKVLDAGPGGVGPGSFFSDGWGMSSSGAVAVVSEYGGQNAPDQARFAFLSEDSGATWTQIYDTGAVAGRHIHGSAYDPWWDAIWVCQGDGPGNQSLQVSWDRGQTWSEVTTATQYVAILPLQDAVLLLTDSATNGVHRIARTPGRGNAGALAVTIAFAIDNAAPLTYLGSMPFRAVGSSHVLLPFVCTNGPGLILTTPDGVHYGVLWMDSASYVQKGPLTLLGPTANGKYVGTLRDDRQASYSRLTLQCS